MATAIKLQNSLNWCKAFLKNQPTAFANLEPALTTGNVILQTMYSAPFKWRHNRGTFSFPTQPAVAASGTLPAVPAASDYVVFLPDFGFLEDQVVISGVNVKQLGGRFCLARPTGQPSRPTEIAAQFDDGLGNITFRLNSMPDQIYLIEGEYQRKVPALTSPGSLLFPMPDENAFVFHWGVLAVLGMLVNDQRTSIWEKNFISRLLGLQDGLSDSDINIFLGSWEQTTKTMMRAQAMLQQGVQGRGV